ncbi:hypothetical protein LTR08_009062 [Meristemomyces frigidus]|nr:hypothetical protein LTR08_009062 [Meristemomyces frigidus]
MAAPQVHHLFHAPVADHSFSADRQTLAVARDTSISLYTRPSPTSPTFTPTASLRGHDKTITGVDIAPRSGRIVTCSQDRNAYVWEASPTGEWKPTLVLLRINRAATGVRWSPSEAKFAVGSGARIIAVCYFEADNDWWVSKHVKKPLRSTVTAIAWHPNSVLLAAGSTDGHARVFSAFIKGTDARPEASVWGERLPFGTVCGEYLNPTAGWVHDVAFSPSGNALAYCAHDSTVTVVYPSAPDQPPSAIISIPTQLLPFTSILWSSETEILAAGYDCGVYRFSGPEWRLSGTLDTVAAAGGGGEQREESALNMFRNMDLKGRSGGGGSGGDDTRLKTVHQNSISTLRAYEGGDGEEVTRISTGGVDGRVVVWTL